MELRTFAWTADTPVGGIEHAALTRPDSEVPAYLAGLDGAAREQRFSFAAYNAGVLPWEPLRWYDAVTGQSGTRCEHAPAPSRAARS
jgi:hypothetical protein